MQRAKHLEYLSVLRQTCSSAKLVAHKWIKTTSLVQLWQWWWFSPQRSWSFEEKTLTRVRSQCTQEFSVQKWLSVGLRKHDRFQTLRKISPLAGNMAGSRHLEKFHHSLETWQIFSWVKCRNPPWKLCDVSRKQLPFSNLELVRPRHYLPSPPKNSLTATALAIIRR